MSEKENTEQFSTFRFEDFIQNEYFVASVLHPDKESRIFWNSFEAGNYANIEDYLTAKEFIISLNHSQQLPEKDEIAGLWNNISRNRPSTKKIIYRYVAIAVGAAASVAACIALFFSLSGNRTGQDISTQEDILSIALNVAHPDRTSNEIQLVLSAENTVALEEDEAEIIYHQDGVSVSDAKIDNADISTYNQLIVPDGKRSVLTMSDSSKIWVNAGTRLVYPIAFPDNKREIYVEGEIFLNVIPDAQRPFTVRTSQANIKVLGTEFNVSTYGGEGNLAVALVTGAVDIRFGDRNFSLKPNDVYICQNGKNSVENNTDIYKYISWKDGLYIFTSERLDVITAHLTRYYGVNIECSETAAGMKCSGKLDLKGNNIESVLNGLAITVPIICTYEKDKVFISSKMDY
jgi:ferric-dicitrate binding protein FerR (iron transport regulator)